MRYQVLARAYRPRRFSEMVGQEHVVKPLKNALLADRLHHAYLFCGTRGTGKTTIARIFAKALNCLNLTLGEPCNQCEHCLEIDEGRFVDLLEIDAASRTKVEDTRELLDNVAYMPAKAVFKIYLIDEVHMLSHHSFNALLKTLEEPPLHVKFLLCTTDPQKCPVTILSRCLQFYLRPLTHKEIYVHLKYVLTQQSSSFEDKALEWIADAAKGSMRDALSLLDQAMSFGAGAVRSQDVLDMMGAIDPDAVLDLLDCVIRQDLPAAFQFLRVFASKNDAYDHLCAALIQAIHGLALAQMLPEMGEDNPSRQARFRVLKDCISPQDVQLLYQFALMGQRDLAASAHPQYGFEMLLMRMIAFIPVILVPEEQSKTEKKNEISALKKGPAQVAPVSSKKESEPPATSVLKEAPSFVHQSLANLNEKERVHVWRQMIETLNVSGIAKQIILHSELRAFENHLLTISLSGRYQALVTPLIKNQIEEALRKSFSPTCQLQILLAEQEVVSPIKVHQEAQKTLQEHANQILQKDEHVRFLQRNLGAKIVPGSVQMRTEQTVKQNEES